MSQSSSSPPARGSKEEALNNYCRARNLAAPVWQVLSDRRGGRTAWSCTVTVGGQTIEARYWYDGQYAANAREDAAERALQTFGVLPAPPEPQPLHYRQQQDQPRSQSQRQPPSSSNQQQPRYTYDVTRPRNTR